ncbi:MAG: TlpA family protein disulfide reductase [Bacteroidetes bacterium]|nr:TlpA family protein disulfide reductase [Bacteroidota bacterium]
MCSQIKKYCCLLSILIISNLCYGQKQFHILIQFAPTLDSTNIEISLDNGKGLSRIPVLVKDRRIEINSEVYSKYAMLHIYSSATASQKIYFITKEESSIIYFGGNKFVKDYPFVNSKLTSAIDLANCPEMEKLKNYTQRETKDVVNFYEKHKDELKTNDSLRSIYKQKSRINVKKNLDFIRLNSNQYFYLWYFNLAFKSTENIEADSLLQYYKEVLYPKYSNLFEANSILDYLKGRTLKINQSAPDFTTTDISGRKFSLKQLRGKYVLLNLWATWCGPCVAELPLIKKLRDDFPADQLKIISISVDNTKADLEKGIKKYGLNWTHVFKDMSLINKYHISSVVPLTFLIDKEGKLVYTRIGSLGDTHELRKLLMNK